MSFVEPKRFSRLREISISTSYEVCDMIKAEFQDIGNKSICHIEPLPSKRIGYDLPNISLVFENPDGEHRIEDVIFLDISTDSTKTITVYRQYGNKDKDKLVLRAEEWTVKDNAIVNVDIDLISENNIKINIS